MAAAAATFDAGDSRNCLEFVGFISDHEVEEAGTTQTVNVMTIHKSKGLTFDMVILPELDDVPRGGLDLVMKRDDDTNQPQWAIKMPREIAARQDNVLDALYSEAQEAAEFERLCVLYVAMTRSRYATYMVVAPKNSPTSAAQMLRDQLAGEGAPPDATFDGEEFTCLYEAGERDWYAGMERQTQAVAEPTPLPADFGSRPSRRQPLVRREPSTGGAHKQKASRLFEERTTDVMQFGTAIHELLERVTWIEDVDVDAIIADWQPTAEFEPDVVRDVIEQFRSCLESPEVRAYLSRPSPEAQPAWIEKRFEIITADNELVAGAFDRVTIVRDKDGKPVEATVLDYKSSVVETPADIAKKAMDYEYQMACYREALSKILHLDESKVRTCLLFTRVASVYEIRP
jgi:ATP-dependent helicase/nuclease subunit A